MSAFRAGLSQRSKYLDDVSVCVHVAFRKLSSMERHGRSYKPAMQLTALDAWPRIFVKCGAIFCSFR
jgi:hypothetical protein